MSANLSSHATEEETIKSVLSAYENALNASNTEAVMSLYTEDGVFLPPNKQSAVGKAAVRQAYNAVFKPITPNVKFTIAELVTMSPEWAFVRTNSAGTNKVNAARSGGYRGQSGAVHLQEGRGRKVADRPLQLLHHYSAVLTTGNRKCKRHGRVSHNG